MRPSILLAFGFLLSAIGALCLLDTAIFTFNPWQELSLMMKGFFMPDFSSIDEILRALL